MKSYIKEPCYILVGCICFFTSISFFSSTFEELKQYDLLSDIKKDDTNDTLKSQENALIKTKIKNEAKHSTIEDNNSLNHFFTCLDSLKKTKKKIRIAHFGDSMIEGDLITNTLRTEFQKEFGGSGVGFISATPSNASFRQSITQEFSKNWETQTIKDKHKDYDIGISGYTSLTNGDSWITLKSVNPTDVVKVFYGKSKTELPFNIEIDSLKYNASTPKDVNEYSHRISNSSVNLHFLSQSVVPIYGLSIESNSGIIVDNFSFRGSSGTFFKDYNPNLLSQFQNHLQYDLIMLQYGINVANAKTTDYKWYERAMLENIACLQKAFPNTSIILIGCSDRAVKYQGKYVTSKGIEPLIETQKIVAQKTGSGFINFYEVMGGKNSMVKWVTGDTCFANKDYTHFNHKGAEKAGKLLYKSIMTNYQIWKKDHEVIY